MTRGAKTGGPVVWIVGASRGVGRSLALEFADIGSRVCLSGRSVTSLRTLAREISRRGGIADVFPCDVRNVGSVTEAERQIRRRVGPVDVLLANSGVTVFRSFLSTSASTLHSILATNLEGQLACVRAVLPSMVRRKSGWIISIGSVAAVTTFTGSSAYTASKAGLARALDVVREEVREYGVRVVNVLPGPVETAMWSPRVRKKYGHRMMRPRSVAEAVMALYRMPPDTMPETLVIRPVAGDLD
jgi:short-subunit dehydrogenase